MDTDRIDRALRRALIELAAGTDAAHVPTSTLVRKAGIGRTTFYRRHRSGADYVETLRRDVLAELERAFRGAQREAGIDDGLYPVLTHRVHAVLSIVQHNAELLRLLCRGATGSVFRGRCRALLADLLAEDFTKLGTRIDAAYCPPEYVLAFLAHAAFGAAAAWLAKPQPEPIDEMTFYLVSLMSGNTADFLE